MTTVQHDVPIHAAGVELWADIGLPASPRGTVIFAHGSGSGRHSPRNRYVAGQLNGAGLATVLADLLTSGEERVDTRTREHRFDIGLLAARLAALVDWAATHGPGTAATGSGPGAGATGGGPDTGRGTGATTGPHTGPASGPHTGPGSGPGVGLFGASTGAGAALVAAAVRPDAVHAVVSRGGRPDLAGDYLPRVHQPTLLVVGGDDPVVLRLNREARQRLRGESELVVVPGASHLFAEPGALERVARLATDWFLRTLPSPAPPEGISP